MSVHNLSQCGALSLASCVKMLFRRCLVCVAAMKVGANAVNLVSYLDVTCKQFFGPIFLPKYFRLE